MNTRIRELLTQAGVGDNWNEADWYSLSPEMLQKFTELIVRECTSFIAKRTNQAIDYDYNVDEAVSIAIMNLLESFGFKL
jgi:hypothetical protein